MNKKEIKEYLKQNCLTKNIYAVLREFKQRKHKRKKQLGMIQFENKGVEILFYTQKIFKLSGVKFFIANGTLLGIIRDNKLITRDMDIDVIVYLEENSKIEDFRKVLIENKYEILHSFSVEDIGITQDTFVIDDVMVDVSYVRKVENKYYPYVLYNTEDEKNKVIVFPFTSGETKEYKYNGIEINVPDNPELFLEESYGKDWRIPNPNYIYWENENGIKLDLKGNIQIYNHFKYQ